MEQYINKDTLVAEIERLISNGQVELQKSQENNDEENYIVWAEHIATCIKVLSLIDTLEVKEVDYLCDENRDKELALSLQIQAYLNTASDELYGNGKPLYSKSHLEGIHECMKMWVKLHDYYFYKHTCENKEVDLEKEVDALLEEENYEYQYIDHYKFAKHFFELGLKAQKGE